MMIEIIGYITVYLLIGVVVMPFMMLADTLFKGKQSPFWLLIYIIGWPFYLALGLLGLWVRGWKELKNYKGIIHD